MPMDKAEFRKHAVAVRNSIDEGERKRKDSRIRGILFENEQFKSAESIGIYHSFGSETDTLEIIWRLIESKKRVFLPKALEKDGTPVLEFYRILGLGDAVSGYRGIPEPDARVCERLRNIDEIEFLIVPGIAFDLRLNRMGYGKGFYDRLLSSYSGFSAGLAYSEQIFEEIPVDENDRTLDMIISDKGIYARS